MIIAPILILGFNRPENVLKIVDAIRLQTPRNVYFAVDGPRKDNPDEFLEVAKTQSSIRAIDWDCVVRTRFRESNIGLRFAIPDAISWVLENEDSVIVIEDDAIPGPDVLQFMTEQLNELKDSDSVFHVSGYNLVPTSEIKFPYSKTRFSIYPESYLWGTWSRAWKVYSDDLGGYKEFLKKNDMNLIEKFIWRLNFKMAELDLVQTWAYRWIYSIWENKGICVSPNVNLTTYIGQTDGTHTRRKSKILEIDISPIMDMDFLNSQTIDTRSDSWISKNVFHANSLGALEQLTAFLALYVLKSFEKLTLKSARKQRIEL